MRICQKKDYKRHIRNKTREAAFVYLQSIKEDHEKVRTNVYDSLKYPQAYITTKTLTNVEKSILFGLRNHTIRSIKMNFSNMYSENSLCPICERSPDIQEHLPLCPVLQSILPLVKHIDYNHIHGSVEQQKNMFRCTNNIWSSAMS